VSATHDGREFFGDAAPPVPPATPPKPVNELFGDIGEPWFTTRIFMDTIEFVHNHLSLAWWGSIIATAVVARSLLLPIQIYNIKNMQGMADLQPQMKELQKIIVAAKTREEKLQAQIQMRDLFVKGGVNQWMLFLGPLTTMPVFLTFFAAIRHLVVNFAPSMAAGGALWFHDLTVSDPYLRLPIINAVVMLCNVQIGLDGMPAQSRGPATW
jgi:YidC/Oxa1 family membrane protein insertase